MRSGSSSSRRKAGSAGGTGARQKWRAHERGRHHRTRHAPRDRGLASSRRGITAVGAGRSLLGAGRELFLSDFFALRGGECAREPIDIRSSGRHATVRDTESRNQNDGGDPCASPARRDPRRRCFRLKQRSRNCVTMARRFPHHSSGSSSAHPAFGVERVTGLAAVAGTLRVDGSEFRSSTQCRCRGACLLGGSYSTQAVDLVHEPGHPRWTDGVPGYAVVFEICANDATAGHAPHLRGMGILEFYSNNFKQNWHKIQHSDGALAILSA